MSGKIDVEFTLKRVYGVREDIGWVCIIIMTTDSTGSVVVDGCYDRLKDKF